MIYRLYLAVTAVLCVATIVLTFIIANHEEPDFTDSGVGCITDCLDS